MSATLDDVVDRLEKLITLIAHVHSVSKEVYDVKETLPDLKTLDKSGLEVQK